MEHGAWNRVESSREDQSNAQTSNINKSTINNRNGSMIRWMGQQANMGKNWILCEKIHRDYVTRSTGRREIAKQLHRTGSTEWQNKIKKNMRQKSAREKRRSWNENEIVRDREQTKNGRGRWGRTWIYVCPCVLRRRSNLCMYKIGSDKHFTFFFLECTTCIVTVYRKYTVVGLFPLCFVFFFRYFLWFISTFGPDHSWI